MKIVDELMTYETPLVELIEIEVEKGFAQSNVENPEEGEEQEW